jgi:regulator of replication initiation timing
MALPNYKDIVELMKKGATVEAQEKIMELREAVIELQEENLALRQENKDLKVQLKLKGEMHFDGSVYWRVEKKKSIGPYCQRCLDAEGKLIRLQDYGDSWYCLQCKITQSKMGQKKCLP